MNMFHNKDEDRDYNERGNQRAEFQDEKAVNLKEKLFFANLAHDLKTPLAVIMSAIQLLEGDICDENYEQAKSLRKHIDFIKYNSDILLRMVENLTTLCKLDSGYFELELQKHNIVEVVEDVVMSMIPYAQRKSIEVIFDTVMEEYFIYCDAEKIKRVIQNLLSNAIKYTEESGMIRVNLGVEKEQVIIIVEDTGVGIPKEKQELIFDRYTRMDNEISKQNEGSGIGLSLVKTIVDMHKGKIRVSSKVGKGSKFEVRLPLEIEKA